MKKKLVLGLILVVLLTLAIASTAFAAKDGITICHLANKNKFVVITVADNSTFGGHISHPGDIIPADEHCLGHHGH